MSEPTRQEHVWHLSERVIDLARGLIVSDNPFLSASIGLLKTEPAQLQDPFACNGTTLFVDADKVLKDFSQTREAPVHDVAHVLIHCLLLHPFVDASVDASAWDLACDIVAEGLVAEIVGIRPGARGRQMHEVIARLDGDFDAKLGAERLYHALCKGSYRDERARWAPLFHVDDHSLWASSAAQPQDKDGPAQSNEPNGGGSSMSAPPPQDAPYEPADTSEGTQGQQLAKATAKQQSESQLLEAKETWERAAKSMRVDLETLSRKRGAGLGRLVRELEVSAHERIDYREFLRQFAVEHEDMRLSDDEFDYIFYTYGLELYRNMPLIEPLEYRNERRIRDFAVVIDTSSSVSAKVVQEFVDATFDVLSSESGFFTKTNIHIIQADARVQSDAKITSLADLDRWRRSIKLRGFGGTDFRPAFRYVQELRQQGEFDDLQGLVYFTDGWGIYPDRMPPYKCAFVFYDEDHRPELVPPWALQVVLHPGQFESLSVY